MKPSIFPILLGAAALALGQQAEPVVSENQDSLRIASALRTKEYQSDPMGHSLTANDPSKDVVLVLDVAGITMEEFGNATSDDFHVMAGPRRCNPSMKISGTINGKDVMRLALIVPKEILNMQLHYKEHPSVPFKAPDMISDRMD